MDFTYSNEQLALQETLQRFIGRDYGFDRRRELSKIGVGVFRRRVGAVCGAWLAGAALPGRSSAGSAAMRVDIMLVMELIGSRLAAGALLEHDRDVRRIAARRRRPSRSSEKCCRGSAPGNSKLALACYEAAGRYDLSHVACAAVRSGAGWRLSGEKTVVLDAPSADYFLVSARSSAAMQASRTAFPCSWSRARPPGLSLFAYPTQSGGRAADLRLDERRGRCRRR